MTTLPVSALARRRLPANLAGLGVPLFGLAGVEEPRPGTIEPVTVHSTIEAIIRKASPDARRRVLPGLQSIVAENHNDGFIVRQTRIMAGGLTLEKGDWVPAPAHNHPSVPGYVPAGLAYLILQDDGNLVFYAITSTEGGRSPVWASGARGDRAVFQPDGNFVLYAGGRAVWASHTCPTCEEGKGKWLGIGSDGNICVYGSAAQNGVFTEAGWCCCKGHGHGGGFWDAVVDVVKDIAIVAGMTTPIGWATLPAAVGGAIGLQVASGGNIFNIHEELQRLPALSVAPIALPGAALVGAITGEGAGRAIEETWNWTSTHPLETVGLMTAATAVGAAAIYAAPAIAGLAPAAILKGAGVVAATTGAVAGTVAKLTSGGDAPAPGQGAGGAGATPSGATPESGGAGPSGPGALKAGMFDFLTDHPILALAGMSAIGIVLYFASEPAKPRPALPAPPRSLPRPSPRLHGLSRRSRRRRG
jgi:hypothetical protein